MAHTSSGTGSAAFCIGSRRTTCRSSSGVCSRSCSPGPNVWWPYKAVFEYPMAERLARLEQPVLVLAPHDDLWEQTERVV